MKKIATIIVTAVLLFVSQAAFCQVRTSGNAKVYDNNGNYKGTQYISANIDSSNPNGSTVTIGNLRLKARVNNTHRDSRYGISVYDCYLTTPDGKGVWACFNKYDNGHYTIVIDYADGKLRYDL